MAKTARQQPLFRSCRVSTQHEGESPQSHIAHNGLHCQRERKIMCPRLSLPTAARHVAAATAAAFGAAYTPLHLLPFPVVLFPPSRPGFLCGVPLLVRLNGLADYSPTVPNCTAAQPQPLAIGCFAKHQTSISRSGFERSCQDTPRIFVDLSGLSPSMGAKSRCTLLVLRPGLLVRNIPVSFRRPGIVGTVPRVRGVSSQLQQIPALALRKRLQEPLFWSRSGAAAVNIR